MGVDLGRTGAEALAQAALAPLLLGLHDIVEELLRGGFPGIGLGQPAG